MKDSPVVITDAEIAFFRTLNEYDRRRYLATKTMGLMKVAVKRLTAILKVGKNTIYRGKRELRDNISPGKGRIRRPGGGAKSKISQHPEWMAAFQDIISHHMAGLPQDEGTVWLDIGVTQIRRELLERGFEVSANLVKQMLKTAGLKQRAFSKSIPLDVVADRDPQFRKIDQAKTACLEFGIPIISIDTKKKEMIGNFKRDGQVYCNDTPKNHDHDFETFSDGTIVPHGIYDIAHNLGFLSIGTSHDTSKFVCDNIERVWREHLCALYPDAKMLVILCDGGGSNSSRHHIVKQDFMDLSDRLGLKILVMHYPPYCSKFNPIEHRLFSQITRSWSGAPLISVVNACQRAAQTVTKTGLKVFATIVDKVYQTKRKVCESFQERLAKQVVFDDALHRWNYVISPSHLSQVIF